MTKNSINPLLIPRIQVPVKNKVSENTDQEVGELQSEFKSEFKQLLDSDNALKDILQTPKGQDVEFSLHALKRIKQRNLEMNNDEYLKIKGAIEKLRNKGGQDSLVVTNKAAYIVDVANNKIVTAMDKEDMAENVFTKIDSTLFVN